MSKMKRYRVIERKDGSFVIQRRYLFMWLLAVTHSFYSLEDALHNWKRISKPDIVVHEWEE